MPRRLSIAESARLQPTKRLAMTPKPIKIPGPDHPIAIAANPLRVVVTVAGRVVADTRKAQTLREAGYPPVQYIPRKDVDTSLLQRTDPPPTAHTRVTALTTASLPAGNARSMPCGLMRRLMKPLPGSRIMWPSIPIALMR